MAKKTRIIEEVNIERGQRMRQGKGWRLIGPEPGRKAFKATLLKRINIGDESVAIFRVLPY